MEITLDMGKNTAKSIQDLAEKERCEFDLMALKIIDLGLRVYAASREADEPEENPLLVKLHTLALENNLLLKEALGHVFSRERSPIKAYDSSAAIHVIESMTKVIVNQSQGKRQML